jgi:amino-acid N-acetyltransferase
MNARTRISQRPTFESAIRLLRDAGLPTEDLTAAHLEHFSFIGPPTQPTGLVGLEILGGVALLRSLVVVPEYQRSGDGQRLLEHAENQSRAHGVHEIFLLTTTAELFFARRGYSRTAREVAPPAIQGTREFAGICPASSAFMSKSL